MIINIKAGKGSSVGNYLTDRDSEAFTIIEGNAKRFDDLAEILLRENSKREISHYSYVLSFKETNITKDKMFEVYNDFKEKMFQSYNNNELEVFSVIHWDDNKPHIHCVVLNGSQVDNSRDLRLYRGYADFSRIAAIQEGINYEHNLSSLFDNYNLLSLTNEQQKRDWLVKKGKYFYDVEDDRIFGKIEHFIKSSKNYTEFINKIAIDFGRFEIFSSDKIGAGFDKSKLLKEYSLILKDNKLSNGDNRVFKSKLFNEVWFNKNLKEIQNALNKVSIKEVKFSQKRHSASEYDKIFHETTQKHQEHITKRKIGKEYLLHNKDTVLADGLTALLRMNLNTIDTDVAEANIERYLDYTDENYISQFIQELKASTLLINEDHVELHVGKKSIKIYNEKFLKLLLLDKNPTNGQGSNTLPSSLPVETFDSKAFEKALLGLKNTKNKNIIRLNLTALFYEKKIKNKKELETILKPYGLNILRIAEDKKRGKYLTLECNGEKVSVYDTFIFDTITKNTNLSSYSKNRDKAIENNLKYDFINNYIKSLYFDLEKQSRVNVKTISDFRLLKSPDIENGIVLSHGIIGSNEYKEILSKNKNEFITQSNGYLRVEKSLNRFQTGKNLADLYMLRGEHNLYLDKDFDEEILKGFKARVEEKKYSFALWDKDNNYLHGTSLLYSYKGEGAKEPSSATKSLSSVSTGQENDATGSGDDLTEFLKSSYHQGMEESGGVDSILDIIHKLENLDISTQAGMQEFREAMISLNINNQHLFSALCSTLDIEISRVGFDKEKGDYATFIFKDKKIAVYDSGVTSAAKAEGARGEVVLLSAN